MRRSYPHQQYSTRKSFSSCLKSKTLLRISAIDSKTCYLTKEMKVTILGSSKEKRVLKFRLKMLLKSKCSQKKMMRHRNRTFEISKGLLLLKIWIMIAGKWKVEEIKSLRKWLGLSTHTLIKQSNLKGNTTGQRFSSMRKFSLNLMKNNQGCPLPVNHQINPLWLLNKIREKRKIWTNQMSSTRALCTNSLIFHWKR